MRRLPDSGRSLLLVRNAVESEVRANCLVDHRVAEPREYIDMYLVEQILPAEKGGGSYWID